MKIFTRCLLVLILPFALAGPSLAAGYTEGKEYVRLANPQPTNNAEQIEVRELFWYGCPHCYRLEPYLDKWLESKPDDVDFVRTPAIVGPPWQLLAQAYYTSEYLGVTDKTHNAIFDTIHKDRKKIVAPEDVKAVFLDAGVSAEDFDKTFNSFAVSVKVNNARLLTKRYAINGVPTVIVNGKYSVSASSAGSNQNILKVVDYLVEQERRAAPVAAARP